MEETRKTFLGHSIRQEIIEDIAANMHEDWRASLADPNSPWLRPDRDLNGNKIPGSEVNINISFDELTPGWQMYNSQYGYNLKGKRIR